MLRNIHSKAKRVRPPNSKLTPKQIRQKRKEDALALAELVYDMFKET